MCYRATRPIRDSSRKPRGSSNIPFADFYSKHARCTTKDGWVGRLLQQPTRRCDEPGRFTSIRAQVTAWEASTNDSRHGAHKTLPAHIYGVLTGHGRLTVLAAFTSVTCLIRHVVKLAPVRRPEVTSSSPCAPHEYCGLRCGAYRQDIDCNRVTRIVEDGPPRGAGLAPGAESTRNEPLSERCSRGRLDCCRPLGGRVNERRSGCVIGE